MRARIALTSLVLAGCIMAPRTLHAGVFELSAGFSYNHSNYSDTDFEWSRRWGASFGYHFNESSEIELSFQDVMDRTKISGFEDTTFHDQIYAANWVQSFAAKGSWFEPYVKVGIGQLDREASGSYSGGLVPPAILDTVTGILGAGLKLHITKGLGVRCEGSTYLTNGAISTWQDNFAFTSGISFYF
jgi:hypothetical protein